MNLRQLECFQAVARHRNFTRAAAELGMAQPAVSVTIQKLEQNLGLILFNRQEKQIALTAEGRRLLDHANHILRQLLDAKREMAELGGLEQGEVSIGMPGMLGSYYFPPILMAFKHRYPDLKLNVLEAGTREIQKMLFNGELDLGIVVEHELPDGLEIHRFHEESMIVCVHREHPFAELSEVSYQQFFAEELALFKPGYFHREFIDQICQQQGLKPRIAFETNLIALTKAIVENGFAISTFLEMVIKDDPDLIAIPFAQPVRLKLAIACKRGGYLSRANRAFLEFMLGNLHSKAG
ncbi:LysR substrate-binding domain-containing protein [Aestuariirhabdus sp. Z084]|uniref:LysR family transcriptional regulator n=1 Tax=Aestuariirhabdus haliotis TaxID=2918751 RepID=UPI00201B444B|nr:LysR substrate-binding domain-containing protein [Aestuariirhabdus haliotis]MCL6416665.1 LysR substrate-binding domain-containing protein [Aestuariirhabdus haliotis]MCL6421099.1 LysR substrate-binding domain-containing protein [Aestuariirhabdus haliotis]